MNVEEITSKFSYNFGDLFDILNIVKVPRADVLKTFQEHDDVIRLDDNDNGPIFCGKFFDEYYIWATGIVNTDKKTITISEFKKIPVKFVNTLPDKHFFTIVDSFYRKVSPNYSNHAQTVAKKTIKDPITNEEIMQIGMVGSVDHQKYLDLQKEYK